MHPLIHSLSRSNRGMKSGHRKERGRDEEEKGGRERTSRDTGLESVPVGIARIERSQERARDPCQKTINTNFANSYTLPERRIALVVQSAHILRLPTKLTTTTNDRHPSSHVCVDCCAHVRLFYLPTSPALPLPISSSSVPDIAESSRIYDPRRRRKRDN